ncbi:MAG: prephenate dehydrogenase/arogenate dehydrogenase family protein [Candidatus Omnitrophica bacterium]|nr:prephenate dehydrogenase/arogenate dehydrogenase family protein [Candidatus Omnitrophota bacterium]
MGLFQQVTIVGLGLIGGSLGMAIRRRRAARTVVGVSRRPASWRRAKRLGAIDWGTTDMARAVAGADVVVLATPVDAIAPFGRRAARSMRPGSVLTDVGSAKAAIVRALERGLPRGIHFVGAHPIAGSEQRGIEAADARLFDGAVCILTPTARTDRRALQAVRRLWSPLVGRVVAMSPQRHDRLLAQLSHLPHLIAYSLAGAIPDSLPRLPQSVLDMTRIARSDPDLWDDIFLANRANLLEAMDRFDARWRALRRLLAGSRRLALRRTLARAQSRRNALQNG